MQKKIGKRFFVFKVTASEFAALNSPSSQKKKCHRQSIC